MIIFISSSSDSVLPKLLIIFADGMSYHKGIYLHEDNNFQESVTGR